MKEIVKPNGDVYCYVSVSDGLLKIKMNQGTHTGYTVELDAKIIPQLRQILSEADFFKVV